MSDDAATSATDHVPTPEEVEELESHTRGVASGIYGLVIASATLATISTTESLRNTLIAVITTTLVYWVAETYAHGLARRLVVKRALTLPERLRIIHESWGLVSATYVPLVVLVVATLVGASIETAINAALVAATVLLGAIGWQAGRASGMAGWRLVFGTALWVLLGLVMVGLKQLLH